MVLTTHAIVGATISRIFFTNSLFAFCAGFASHFVLDALPHWDYILYSKKKSENNPLDLDMVIGRSFLRDLFNIGLDFFIGIVASLFIFNFFFKTESVILTLFGAIGGIFPDILQFFYMKIRREPLVSLQKFHHFVHTSNKIRLKFILGSILQVAIILFFIGIYFLYK